MLKKTAKRLNVAELNPDIVKAIEKQRTAPHVFADKNWHTWGGSVIKGDDGRYHMFYARWPKKYSFYAWLTHSEVAHAVADKPEGPFTYVETALKGRGDGHWDAVTAHNPKIKFFDGKYYLYYIGTNIDHPQGDLIETARVGYKHPNWGPLRTNQRTGVAVSNSINGPWQRNDVPLIEPSGPISTLTVNPAIARGPDGMYYLIVKGDKPDTTKFLRDQAIATSNSPTGPFTMQPQPVIKDFDTEDMSMWYDKMQGLFFAVYHAHTRLGLVSSVNGIDWETASQDTLMKKGLPLIDAKLWMPDRHERPFILTDDEGRAIMLSLLFFNVDKSKPSTVFHSSTSIVIWQAGFMSLVINTVLQVLILSELKLGMAHDESDCELPRKFIK